MALTEDQLITIRRAVGDKPDDAALNVIYDRTADVDVLILEVLERRLANLKAVPDSFSVPGEYSQSTGKQIDALQAEVSARGGSGHTVRIVDPDPPRPR